MAKKKGKKKKGKKKGKKAKSKGPGKCGTYMYYSKKAKQVRRRSQQEVACCEGRSASLV